MPSALRSKVRAGGLVFPECPRWRDGELWLSDMEDRAIYVMEARGTLRRVASTDAYPAGLGWRSDGRLLFCTMQDQKIWCLEADGRTHVVADLSALAVSHCNDMVVDASGRAFVGTFGFDVWRQEAPQPGVLVSIDQNGTSTVAARDLSFPNGMVFTEGGRTLIVAETFGSRLTAFDIEAAGSLGNRRLWADLGGDYPDGMTIDAQGAVWVALPLAGECRRVEQGGRVTDVVTLEGEGAAPLAAALGGETGRTLFITAFNGAQNTVEERRAVRGGTIQAVEVDVPAPAPG